MTEDKICRRHNNLHDMISVWELTDHNALDLNVSFIGPEQMYRVSKESDLGISLEPRKCAS